MSKKLCGILTDNSTLISVDASIPSRAIDANVVYNLSSMCELIVLNETLWVPPAIYRSFESVDKLFTKGYVQTVQFPQLDFEPIGFFREVISRARHDLGDRKIKNFSAKGTIVSLKKVDGELRRLKEKLLQDPKQFIDHDYLVPVMDTDKFTATKLRPFWKEMLHQHYNERDFAQYLLRSNTMFQLSRWLPYHPHSHRLPYFNLKLREQRKEAKSLAKFLLSQLEKYFEKRSKTLNEIARQVFELQRLRRFDLEIPIVMIAVLRDCSSPDGIIDSVIDLRETKKARNFRDECGKLIEAYKRLDPVDAQKRLDRAKQAATNLRQELWGLSEMVIESVPKVATQNWVELATKVGKHGIRLALDRLKNRHFALLRELRKKTKHVGSINQILVKVYGQELSKQELTKFMDLWSKV